MRRMYFGILVVVLLLVGAACGLDKAQEPYKDAARGESNEEPADTFTMPDGYNNGSSKCDHGNRVYTIFHGDSAYGSVDVVRQDPTCPGARVGE